MLIDSLSKHSVTFAMESGARHGICENFFSLDFLNVIAEVPFGLVCPFLKVRHMNKAGVGSIGMCCEGILASRAAYKTPSGSESGTSGVFKPLPLIRRSGTFGRFLNCYRKASWAFPAGGAVPESCAPQHAHSAIRIDCSCPLILVGAEEWSVCLLRGRLNIVADATIYFRRP